MTTLTGAQGGKIRAGGKPGRSDPRGNSTSRARRSEKLLNDTQFTHTEVGKDVHCVHCGTMLTYERGNKKNTLEQDRKNPGGPYAYHNIQPACRNCNVQRSNNPNWQGPLATKE